MAINLKAASVVAEAIGAGMAQHKFNLGQQELKIEDLRECIWKMKPKMKQFFTGLFAESRDEMLRNLHEQIEQGGQYLPSKQASPATRGNSLDARHLKLQKTLHTEHRNSSPIRFNVNRKTSQVKRVLTMDNQQNSPQQQEKQKDLKNTTPQKSSIRSKSGELMNDQEQMQVDKSRTEENQIIELERKHQQAKVIQMFQEHEAQVQNTLAGFHGDNILDKNRSTDEIFNNTNKNIDQNQLCLKCKKQISKWDVPENYAYFTRNTSAPKLRTSLAPQMWVDRDSQSSPFKEKQTSKSFCSDLETQNPKNQVKLIQGEKDQARQSKVSVSNFIDQELKVDQNIDMMDSRDLNQIGVAQTKAFHKAMQFVPFEAMFEQIFEDLVESIKDKITLVQTQTKKEKLSFQEQREQKEYKLFSNATFLAKMAMTMDSKDEDKQLNQNDIVILEQVQRRQLKKSKFELCQYIIELEHVTRTQRTNYLKELKTYRMAAVQVPKEQEGQNKHQTSMPVQFFDETDGLDKPTKEILNERLKYMRAFCTHQIYLAEIRHAENERKLAQYENLPIDRQFLAKMPLSEIFTAVKILTDNKRKVWDELDKAYGQTNCMEDIVLKIYNHLFKENSDKNFSERMQEIEFKSQVLIRDQKAQYEALLEQERASFFAQMKRAETAESKLQEVTSIVRQELSKSMQMEFERQINKVKAKMELQKIRFHEEILELNFKIDQAELTHQRQTFQNCIFRWTVLAQLQKLHELDKTTDRYKNYQQTLEHKLKTQVDNLVENKTEKLRLSHQIKCDELNDKEEECVSLTKQLHNAKYEYNNLLSASQSTQLKVQELEIKYVMIDRDNRRLQFTNQGLAKHAELRDAMIQPLKKQNQLLTNRIKEYEFIKNCPKSRIDIFTVCTREHKLIEENNLLAKISNAASQLLQNSIVSVGRPLQQDREVQSHLSGTNNRIVYDYNFGKDLLDDQGCQVKPREFSDDKGLLTDVTINDLILKVEHEMIRKDDATSFKKEKDEQSELIDKLKSQLEQSYLDFKNLMESKQKVEDQFAEEQEKLVKAIFKANLMRKDLLSTIEARKHQMEDLEAKLKDTQDHLDEALSNEKIMDILREERLLREKKDAQRELDKKRNNMADVINSKNGWKILQEKLGTDLQRQEIEEVRNKTQKIISTMKRDVNLVLLRRMEKIAYVDFKDQLSPVSKKPSIGEKVIQERLKLAQMQKGSADKQTSGSKIQKNLSSHFASKTKNMLANQKNQSEQKLAENEQKLDSPRENEDLTPTQANSKQKVQINFKNQQDSNFGRTQKQKTSQFESGKESEFPKSALKQSKSVGARQGCFSKQTQQQQDQVETSNFGDSPLPQSAIEANKPIYGVSNIIMAGRVQMQTGQLKISIKQGFYCNSKYSKQKLSTVAFKIFYQIQRKDFTNY